MSSDNYYVVRRHPAGDFTFVMGFMSDIGSTPVPVWNSPRYPSVEAALSAAHAEYSEYGVSVHHECGQPAALGEEAFELLSLMGVQGIHPGNGVYHPVHMTVGKLVSLLELVRENTARSVHDYHNNPCMFCGPHAEYSTYVCEECGSGISSLEEE